MKEEILEKDLKIKTKDGHYVYGTISSPKKVSSKLVIFCHGFTGHKDEHIHFNGAKFMNENGYNSFRFSFYYPEKGARHFEETKISQHGDDITDVLTYFKDKYEKIYLVGHSYGGTSLLFVDSNMVDGLVFWDGIYIDSKREKKYFEKDRKKFGYVFDVGMNILIGKDYIKELYSFPDCGELVKKIKIPVKFIGAEKGAGKDAKKLYSKANQPKELTIIDEADHCFNTFKSEEKLFQETLNWIKNY